MRFFVTVPFLALFACSGGSKDDTAADGGTDVDSPTDTDGGDDDDDDDDDGCSNALLSTVPESGATGAFYRTDVIASLKTEDPAATLSVSGTTGTTAIEGTVVAYTPDAPLTPGSSYTATLTYECGEETWDFTVGNVGGDTNEAALVGSTYSLDLSSGTWVLPAGAGVGDIIGGLVADVEVLFGVISVEATTIPMIGAIGAGGQQDICVPTLDFPVDPSWDNPYWEVSSPSLNLTVSDFVISVTDVTIGGAFTADANSIQGGVLKGSIDTRPLVDALSPGGGDGAVCDIVGALGVTCVPCGDNQPFCLEVWVTDIDAAKLPGVTIVPLDKPDPSCP